MKNLLDTFNYIPWDAFRYVIGQINYGGRVTDEWDRRLLASMLMKYCNELVLKDHHLWTKDGVYYSLEVGPLDSYRDYINTLPDDDSTEIFGLHQNARINFQNKESTALIQTLLLVQA